MAISLDKTEHTENIYPIGGTKPVIRSYRLNRGKTTWFPLYSKVRSMILLLAAFLIGLAVLTGCILADSGLRLWSSAGVLAAQRKLLMAEQAAALPELRAYPGSRNGSVRVSSARSAPLRAAA